MTRALRLRRFLQIGFLAVFAVLSVGIGFFHTENNEAGQATCPACHFLAFSQAVGPVLSFVLPLLIVLGAVRFDAIGRVLSNGRRLFLNRSPPTA